MAANHATREKINWLLLEGVLIVASILLAFWIDAWWDGRKDALEEQEILVGLEVEFADLRDRLDLWANRNRAGAKLIERLLSESVTEMKISPGCGKKQHNPALKRILRGSAALHPAKPLSSTLYCTK